MSSIKITKFDGDLSLGRNLSIGGKTTIQGNSHFKGGLKIDGWLDAPNIKGANKGIFTSVEKLKAEYPFPRNGWYAFVGTSLPASIYVGDGGNWVNTGGTGGNMTADVQQFHDDLESLQDNFTSELAELENKKLSISDLAQSTGSSTTTAMSQDAVSKILAGLLPDQRADNTPYISVAINDGDSGQNWETFNRKLDEIASMSDPMPYNGDIRYFISEGLRVDVTNRIFDSSEGASRRLTQVVTGNVRLDERLDLALAGDIDQSFWRIYKEGAWSEWKAVVDITVDTSLSDSSENPVQNKIISKKIHDIESYVKGLNEDVISTLPWIKKQWVITENDPNGVAEAYSSVQKIWYAKFDITNYDTVTTRNLINGSPLSSAGRDLCGLLLYGDGILVQNYSVATDKIVINVAEYSQYTKLELIAQAKSTSDEKFISKDGASVIVYSNSAVASKEDFKNLSDKVENNAKDISNINTLIEGINEDIAPSLSWIRKQWAITNNNPNGVEETYSSVQKIWYIRLDITNYDTVTTQNLINGSPISTPQHTLNGLLLYGDGNLVQNYSVATDKIVINVAEYSQYTKLELIVQAKSTSDEKFISKDGASVIVFKTGFSQEKSEIVTKIVLVGDSLCGNDSALIIRQLKNILKQFGFELIKRCQGGENTIGNLTRAGGLGIRVKQEFTIPSEGSVTCAIESAWIKSDGKYHTTPYNSINDGQKVQAVINGIRGKISKTDIDAVGLAFYTVDGTFIKSHSESGTVTVPVNATQYAYTINNPKIGEPHITINDDAVDIEANATRNGYINNSGEFVESELFKCSELLPVEQGSIYFDSLATSLLYTFTRLEAGDASKVGVGNVFFDAALYDDADYPHIWFTGQNGGYETEEDWANMVRSAANNFTDKYIVCSTPHERTTDKLIYQANKCFGKRYLNLRAYTQGQAVYDGQALGIIDSQYNASDYESLFWPGGDKVHQNNLLSYIWAVKMWNMLVDFGYIDGERITSGEYYLP